MVQAMYELMLTSKKCTNYYNLKSFCTLNKYNPILAFRQNLIYTYGNLGIFTWSINSLSFQHSGKVMKQALIKIKNKQKLLNKQKQNRLFIKVTESPF